MELHQYNSDRVPQKDEFIKILNNISFKVYKVFRVTTVLYGDHIELEVNQF